MQKSTTSSHNYKTSTKLKKNKKYQQIHKIQHNSKQVQNNTVETYDKKTYDKKSRPSNSKKISENDKITYENLRKSKKFLDFRVEIHYFLSYVSTVQKIPKSPLKPLLNNRM